MNTARRAPTAVYGEDARALLESLKRPASRTEMAARISRAKARLSSTTGTVVYTTAPLDERRVMRNARKAAEEALR